MGDTKNSIQVLFGNNVQKHLSIIETGTQFASAQVIEKLSTELQVSPAELFGGDMNMKYANMIFKMLATHIDTKIESLYVRLSEDLRTRN